jgi:hypothetical protein
MADSFYATTCFPWNGTGSAFIPSTSYVPVSSPITPISPPNPMDIYIQQTLTIDSTSYEITFVKTPYEQLANVSITFVSAPTGLPNYITTVQSYPNLEIVITPSAGNTTTTLGTPFDIQAMWIEGPTGTMPGFNYDDRDTYTLTVDKNCTPSQKGVSSLFSRSLGFNLGSGDTSDGFTGPTGIFMGAGGGFAGNVPINTTLCGCNQFIDPCLKVVVPIITIDGQSTYFQDYLSDMLFTIQDKYQYYCYDKCILKNPNKKCRPIYIKQKKIKTTTFLEFNPPMQDVVKGKGCTLRDKLLNYYTKHLTQTMPSFNDFYILMTRYGMAKYILAKILYGDFNIKYLCRNFNKQFFKDLKKTRFCGFIDFFNNPANGVVGFDHYFIKCCIDSNNSC